jgi:hypothetical protein
MADQLPRPETVGGAVWAHDWYPYESYKSVHDRYITNAINEGIIVENHLVFDEIRQGRRLLQVNIRGRIQCEYGLSVFVDKWLEVDPGQNVRGYSYSYQAWMSESNQEVIRYDSAYGLNDLHCHLFDLNTGRESIYPVPMHRLPTLDAFIRIAMKLVRYHLDRLD